MTKIRLLAIAVALSWLPFSAESAVPFTYSCVQCRSMGVITSAQETKEAFSVLQDGLRSRIGGARIEKCSFLVGENFGEGFAAFGGSCDVTINGKTLPWMLCADNGVGNFAAVTGVRWWPHAKAFLAKFTDLNCVGG